MNLELTRLLLELETKFDNEVHEYFSFTEEKKQELTDLLINYYLNKYKDNPLQLVQIMNTCKFIIENAEEEENYEKADIFNRVVKGILSSRQ